MGEIPLCWVLSSATLPNPCNAMTQLYNHFSLHLMRVLQHGIVCEGPGTGEELFFSELFLLAPSSYAPSSQMYRGFHISLSCATV